MRITFETENKTDADLLLLLAKRLKAKVVSEEPPELPKRKNKDAVYYLEKLAESGGVSGIEDPVKWQREQRKDRKLPIRK